ncbi:MULTISPECIES: vWA domain-containing protein [unclassified Flavobacterium]|uniref:vWA domain-containing protein n=1 Tax=unclassified Flavobacterium TaxID=196869 RepID=UPI000580A07C|nr:MULTISPECIES: vWA domain-containing protein [unclassified Flavobacterium]KIC02265.1 von Willebrand factor type A [Flavobacterium sp. JRM]MEA9415259.1 vWA domain-containing protein [Flavobacterium sp. PL02]OUL62137.1 VWA domain-containing protein [Flavobacterium sp. AJR]
MKTSILISALLATTFSFANSNYTNANFKKNTKIEKPITAEKTKIQVALLLDTSSSMDGLIDQAKSRLWNIVNTLTTLKYNGQNPDIEIALYEYGNDGLSKQSNYIRQIAPLSTDLDLISEKLFSLSTNGGNEYCGAVIQDATKQLKWAKDNNNMKLIYIAGNEEFNQGGINYKEAISNALKNDIYVNTIYCGDKTQGINELWKDGADYGKGKYFNIDSNQTVRYIVTPYDVEITKCNEKINKTYIGYGSKGSEKKMNQEKQDRNAQGVSASNYAERAVSKSKAVYKNDSWDLVDKVKDDATAISKIKKEELPAELQNKSTAELKVIVAQKTKERENIQKEISELAKKRQGYIDTEAKKTKKQDDLGNAINTSIVALAKVKGYTVEK